MHRRALLTVTCLLGIGCGGNGGSDASPADGATDSASMDAATADSGAGPAAASCQAILAADPFSTDGMYDIDPDGPGGNASFRVYCLMTQDSGGWTLAATVTNADGNPSWGDPTAWPATATFGGSSSNGYSADMKNAAWSALSFTQIRFETSSGGIKVSDPIAATTLASLFSSSAGVSLTGTATQWSGAFFAEIQNPPTVAFTNVAGRDACVLAMDYDEQMTGGDPTDDFVSGYGCIAGSNGSCAAAIDCGDAVASGALHIFIR